jgi:hypothetical protein
MTTDTFYIKIKTFLKKNFCLNTQMMCLMLNLVPIPTIIEPTKLQECKYKNNHRSDQIPVLKLL